MTSKKTIFLTGVTGALGKELIKQLLETGDENLFLLVRRRRLQSHWDRSRKILAGLNAERFLGTRIQVFEGDVTKENFGLDEKSLDKLKKEVTSFFHVAALTALNGSKKDCTKINVGGTSNALALAKRLKNEGQLERFFYFSTAYVAGSKQTYISKEDGLPSKPAHANYYESSKYEAEQNVRKAMAEGLPTTIFRPSIVVGHSETGEVAEFNVIYPFIKLFAHGILKKLPTKLENSFNIVPIDFVARSAIAIARQDDSVGRAFHLVTEEPPTMEMLFNLKEKAYPSMPEVEIVDPAEFKKSHLDLTGQMVFAMLQPYLGYLNEHLSFDASNTREALKDTDVEFPKTDENFLKVLMDYAIQAGYIIVNETSSKGVNS